VLPKLLVLIAELDWIHSFSLLSSHVYARADLLLGALPAKEEGGDSEGEDENDKGDKESDDDEGDKDKATQKERSRKAKNERSRC
jgi:hypothetical protein